MRAAAAAANPNAAARTGSRMSRRCGRCCCGAACCSPATWSTLHLGAARAGAVLRAAGAAAARDPGPARDGGQPAPRLRPAAPGSRCCAERLRLLAGGGQAGRARVAVGVAQVAVSSRSSRAGSACRCRAWLLLYVLVASYHELGRMLDRPPARGRSGRSDDRTVQPDAVRQPRKQMSMRAADRYAAEGRFAEGGATTRIAGRSARASPAAHARFRELLVRAADSPGLLLHARPTCRCCWRRQEERGAGPVPAIRWRWIRLRAGEHATSAS